MNLTALLSGAGVGAGLIIAIGAQNAFVLAQGLRRHYPFTVAFICALSDALLILAGVAGLGSLIAANEWATNIARWGGAAFLIVYGIMALRRAMSPEALKGKGDTRGSFWTVVAQTLAVTYLNPHVYLDTVVLLGSIASGYDAEARPYFAFGAMGASFLWFFAIALGASLLAPILARPITWRIVDLLTASVMFLVAWTLVKDALF